MNYSDIVQVAMDYADRTDDTDVESRMDNFLRMVEARVNRTLQTGRQARRAHIYTTKDATFYTLPVDFAGMRNIVMKDLTTDHAGVVLDYVSPEMIQSYIRAEGAMPVYTIVAGSLQVWPVLDSKVLEIVYYQQLPELTTLAPTNWLTTAAPDVYIQGLLVEIMSFVRDHQASAMWDERFRATLAEMQYDDSLDRWSGPSPAVRIA